jgi:FkbM family methyltransferase
MSYSQRHQDTDIVTFYKEKRNAFFVDIGASNGIEISNTYLLEKDFGWKGICVEPVPEVFETLVKNRPNSVCCSDAVYSESNISLQFDISFYNGNNELSGISEYIDIYKEVVDNNKKTITIKSISLTDLLTKYNAPSFIEYLSLDTEGSEYEILKNFNFDKYIFGRIDIEHNYVEPRRTEIRDLLINNGYSFLKQNSVDDCYVHFSAL